MANSTSIQILEDGPSRVVVKLEGVIDTADVAYTTVVDPATLATVDPTGSNYLKATKLKIDKITHNIKEGISVSLFWDATTPVRIESLTGRDTACYRKFGGLQNNAGTFNSQGIFTPAAGFTGRVSYSTVGFTGLNTYTFSLIIYMTKQY